MMVRNLAYCWVIYSFIGYSFGAEFMETKHDFIKTCQRKLPDHEFVPCSTESIQILFTKLSSTGIDGLDTRIDPIHLRTIKIFSSDGPVSLKTSLSNAVVTGFRRSKIIRSYVNPVDYSWEANIQIPMLKVEGNYDLQGRILLLPLQGKGKSLLEPQNMDILVNAKSRLYEKHGHIFYNITEVRVDFNMTGLRVRLDNLFNGIKSLEESTNQFLNENWKPVSEAFKPLIKQTIEDIFLDIINKVFNYIPAEYIVSDIPHPSELYKKDKR